MFEFLQRIQEELKIDYSPFFNLFISYFPKIIASFVMLIIFWLINRMLQFLLKRGLERANVSLTIVKLLTKVLRFVVYGIAALTIADQLKIEIVPILSTLGVIGIAVGLAAQQTVANVISGIIILVSQPFKEGDWVELEDIFGRVVLTSLRSTHIVTKDNLLVDIPNQRIVEARIINHTYHNQIRLCIGVGIAYKEYIPTAQEVLLKVVKDDDRMLTNPAPQVVLTEIADSSINLELQVWIKNSNDEIPMTYELRKKVKMALDEAGIEIPFPHRQLFIENVHAQGLEQYFPQSVK